LSTDTVDGGEATEPVIIEDTEPVSDPQTGLPLAGETIAEPTEVTPTSPPSLDHTIVT
jgi:hypothetical protein